MKIYAGAPAAARCYVEADRGRADDYYLAEGAGVARRFTATDGRVTERAPLTGEAYEAWVAGRDPATGQPRGILRHDGHAVRFAEVVVNGPKTWSLAAALHQDIAAAYETAQDRAAGQILGWLSVHATTRVGSRGVQVPVPVQVLEAATVRHYTSRAGDPHWHLHLQINARVFAARKWRGLWTVDVRDSLAAINGIGYAAMATDPQFRAALAAHGYTKDATGEIVQLARYVGPFSARQAQIARNADRYESEWTAAHPGEAAGPALRRSWDARAWADSRPDKVTPRPGTDLTERWRTELHELGVRAPTAPVPVAPTPVGALNRDQLVDRALARVAAARSAWNPADVRGEVERLIAAAGVVAEAGVRLELAEDLTARAMRECVPLLDRDGVPEHLRAWTSASVLDVESDLTARLAARATAGPAEVPGTGLTPPVERAAGAGRPDPGQAAAVAALAGHRPLVVVEGAAGAGKTTTLSATRRALEPQGRRLVVVTPTLKAAKAAEAEVGARAGSAAWLAHQHGWRWNGDGAWTRLAVGDTNPVSGSVYTGPGRRARLRPGDLLVVDEAGMLDQDTARALLTVADECQVRVALLGDRHQLAAVGRGGVLDLAAGQVDPGAHLRLDGVHRFTQTDASGHVVPDIGYAELTLAMRTAEDPDAIFDALLARGQIRLHPDPEALRRALAGDVAAGQAAGERMAVVVDTREQTAELNEAIRDRLVAAGRVDDRQVVITQAGERIGVGDRIATRRNDPDLAVANRDTWLVVGVGRGGGLLVTPAGPPADTVTGNVHGSVHGSVQGSVTPPGDGPRVLPADYVAAHVELAYASTAHGVQGDTVDKAHLVVGEHTGAASAYVGMTRGRQANTAHLVAADPTEAREQWIAVFARDRADLGPTHAAERAAAEAARYAPPRPLAQVLAELRAADSAVWRCSQRLDILEPQRTALAALVAAGPHPGQRVERLQATARQAFHRAEEARRRAQAADTVVTADADRLYAELWHDWHTERRDAADAAAFLWQGPGPLGLHRGTYRRATEYLTAWADAWRPLLPAMPTDPQEIAEIAGHYDCSLRTGENFAAAARAHAEQDHPEHAALAAAAAAADAAAEQAYSALTDARHERDYRTSRFGRLADLPDPAARLADTDRELAATRTELAATQARIDTLMAEPSYRHRPPDEPINRPVDQPTAGTAGRDVLGSLDHPDLIPACPRPPATRHPATYTGIGRLRPDDVDYPRHRPGPGRGIGR